MQLIKLIPSIWLACCLPTLAHAAFPTIPTSGAGTLSSGNGGATNVTTHALVLPATINAGDLLIAAADYGHQTFGTHAWDDSTAGTWTELTDFLSASGEPHIAIYYKIADGTEDGLTLAPSTSPNSMTISYAAFAITNWHGTTPPEIATTDHGGVTTASPPALNPTGWDAEDALWLVILARDGNGTTTTYPASYTGTAEQISSSSRPGGLAWGFRQLNTASEDPGDFTFAVETAITATIAIRPAAGAASGLLLRRRRN